MKGWSAFVFISVLLLSWGCAHTQEPVKESTKQNTPAVLATTAGMPAVEVAEPFFDFGEVNESSVYLHTFIIKNRGTGVLEIKNVVPG